MKFTNNALDLHTKLIQQRNIDNLQKVKQDAADLIQYVDNNTRIPKTGEHNSRSGRVAWLNNKIKNRMKRWGTLYGNTPYGVCKNIITDNTNRMAATFAKDPQKQNLTEIVHLTILRNNGFIMEDLPNSGTDQVTFINGNKIFGPIDEATREYGMNCDFKTTYIDKTTSKQVDVYFTSKLTNGKGGLQSYQVNCISHWLTGVVEWIQTHPTDNTKFVAIVDGTTFTMNKCKNIKILQNMIEEYKDRIYIGTTESFIVDKFISTS